MDSENLKENKLRKKAEEIVRNNFNRLENQSTDMDELVHNLRVHQIELEIQNEELKLAQLKIEDSQRKYFDLYNFAPLGYFTLDNDGLILEVNLAGAALLGIEKVNLQKMAFIRYITPNCRNKFHQHLKEVLENGFKQTFELKLLRKDNHSFYALLDLVTVSDDNGNVQKFRIAATDITKFKNTEKKLREYQENLEDEVKNRTEELNKSLEELRNSETLLSSVTNLSSDVIYVKDRQSRLIYVNPALERITGKVADYLLGKTDLEFYSNPEIGKTILENDSRIMDSGKEESVEEVVETLEGMRSFISVKTPRFNEIGQVIGLVGISHDITESKRAEKELKLSEKKYHSLYSTMSEGVAIHEIIYNQHKEASDYVITDINQAYEDITGFKKNDVIGRKASELYGIGIPPYLEIYSVVAETGEPTEFETYFEPMDKYFSIKVTSPEKGKFATFFEDITAQEKFEEALHESEERFRDLADNIPNLAWMADADGWIFWYNKQWYEYTGTTLEEMEGWGWQKVHHPDYVKSVTQEWSTSIKEGKPYDNIFPLKGKDGNYRWFLTRITPIKDSKGKIQRWFGTNTDITERKNREEELEITMKKLEQSNKDLEQFAYITSHDLREPLRMITSFLQLLERRYKDKLDEDANEFIEFAVDGAKRLDAMTNDLLKYSKITSEQRKNTSVNFEHVLEHALTNLKVQIEENKAVITHDPLPTINGDEQLKVQLFQNLIGNAIKYRSQETPKIHISATKEKNKYLFSIKDNGIGMSHKHLEKIFTIFQRLHTKEYEGTGIGLAIAQKIVHQQGGQIWVESELGKGSTFYFTIPCQ